MKRLAMSEQRVWVKAFAAQYRKATKKEKGAILDRFIEATGYKRDISVTTQLGCSATRVGGCGWGRGWCCRGR